MDTVLTCVILYGETSGERSRKKGLRFTQAFQTVDKAPSCEGAFLML